MLYVILLSTFKEVFYRIFYVVLHITLFLSSSRQALLFRTDRFQVNAAGGELGLSQPAPNQVQRDFRFYRHDAEAMPEAFGGGGPFTSAFVMPAGIFHQAVERAQSHRRTHRPPFLPVQKPPWAVVEGQGYGATSRR